MTTLPSHVLLQDLLANPIQDCAPYTVEKVETSTLYSLPEPNDKIWKDLLGVNPAYCAQLWLACTVINISEHHAQNSATASIDVLTNNLDWFPKIAPFITDDYLAWLKKITLVNPLIPLLTAKSGLSAIAREVWFGAKEHKQEHLAKLDTFNSVDVYESNIIGHGLLLRLMQYADDPKKVSEKDHRHWAHLNLLWGMRGYDPLEYTNSLGIAWVEIGSDFDVADPEPSNFPKTRSRLNLAKQVSSDIRLFNFANLLPMVSTIDDIHPQSTSELCTWARLDGVRGPATFYDGARAFIPEFRQEFTHLEALGVPIKEACSMLRGHKTGASLATVSLPIDMTSEDI